MRLFSLVAALFVLSIACAQPRLTPVSTPTVFGVNDTVRVVIDIDSVTGLRGYGVVVHLPTSQAQWLYTQPGTLLSGSPGALFFSNIDTVNGVINVAGTLTGNGVISGSGSLCSLTLRSNDAPLTWEWRPGSELYNITSDTIACIRNEPQWLALSPSWQWSSHVTIERAASDMQIRWEAMPNVRYRVEQVLETGWSELAVTDSLVFTVPYVTGLQQYRVRLIYP
ncbi:MAG: cohesin domain-containing protein [bacterium]|nr:cohesin domain-containing protein [bacterium]